MSLVPILQNIAQLFLIYWEGNSGDKLLERQTRASEWYYQIEKGFSQPNGGTAQSDLKATQLVNEMEQTGLIWFDEFGNFGILVSEG